MEVRKIIISKVPYIFSIRRRKYIPKQIPIIAFRNDEIYGIIFMTLYFTSFTNLSAVTTLLKNVILYELDQTFQTSTLWQPGTNNVHPISHPRLYLDQIT